MLWLLVPVSIRIAVWLYMRRQLRVRQPSATLQDTVLSVMSEMPLSVLEIQTRVRGLRKIGEGNVTQELILDVLQYLEKDGQVKSDVIKWREKSVAGYHRVSTVAA
jgi:hypothetical protein